MADLKHERSRVETELEEAREAARDLRDTRRRIEDLEQELDVRRADLAEVDGGEETQGIREELAGVRTARERTRRTVDRQTRQVESMEAELEAKEAELADLEVDEDQALAEELAAERERLEAVEREVDTLQTLYNANREVLEADHIDLVADVERDLRGDALACWVCGAETDRETVADRLEDLATEVTRRRENAADLRETVEDLAARRGELEERRQRQTDLERKISDLRSRLAERREDLSANRERLAQFEERLNDLESQAAETDDRREQLRTAVARLEAQLEDLRTEAADLAAEADRRDALADRVDALAEEIEELRSRRERRIESVRSGFETALADVVETLDPSFEAARLEKHTDPDTGRTTCLELVIARDGRTIGVDRLSEGEVELVAVIAALAGYEAFDVADRVPVMLLDEVGGLAADNLRALVDYLADRTECLLTTAYPETGDFGGHTIFPAAWSVVSDREGRPPDVGTH